MTKDALASFFERVCRQWCSALHASMCMCLASIDVSCSREMTSVSHAGHATQRCEKVQQACSSPSAAWCVVVSSSRVVSMLRSELLYPYGMDGMCSQATVERWLWTLSCGRDGQAGETDVCSTTIDYGTVSVADMSSSCAV